MKYFVQTQVDVGYFTPKLGGAASFKFNEAMRAAMDQLRQRAVNDNAQELFFFDER